MKLLPLLETCSILNPSHAMLERTSFNLYVPRFLYIGQAFRYSLENAFYIFNQQIYFII